MAARDREKQATTSPAAIVEMSATAIAAAVRAGTLTPTAVVQAHLDRIREVDPRLNAFQVVLEQSAIAEADALIRRPDLAELPLAGVPVAIKDNVDVAGQPTRHGSDATSAVPATADALLVQRLRSAGCVVIGKTRLPELAIFPFTESEAYGATRNPWDPARTPGGSSGGSAVAVATGMAALALGSDGGGSIRIPAAACGIFGLKPAPGLVPVPGARDTHWLGLSAFGPLARTVADAALMLDVLTGHTTFRSPIDPTWRMKIAVSRRHPALGGRVSAEVVAALRATVTALRGAGHTVTMIDPPYPLTPHAFLRCWLGGIAEDADGLRVEALEPRTRSMAAAGRALQRRGLVKPAADMAFGARVRRWFSGLDLLITPVVAGPPPRVEAWRGKDWITTATGVAYWMGFTPPWNLAGLPAASVPSGRSSDGLPLAVQLVGPPGGEELLLSVATLLERLRPWPLWRP